MHVYIYVCVSLHSCYCKHIVSLFQTPRHGSPSAIATRVLTYTTNTSEEVVAVTTLLGCGMELETIRVTVLKCTELGFAAMVFLNMWMEGLPVVVTGVLTVLSIAVE